MRPAPLLVLAAIVCGQPLSASDCSLPVPLSCPAPEYVFPRDARPAEGTVVLRCLVDAEGRVREVAVARSTDPRFNDAAVRAVGKWLFRPAQRDGEIVPARIEVPIFFRRPDGS